MTAERPVKLTQLIKDESARLWRFIRGRVPTPEDADDVLQDVLAQLSAVTGPVEIAAGWLYTVARNRIIDRQRKRRFLLEGDVDFGLDAWVADGNPEDDYLEQILWRELEAGLAALPRAQREVFVWHELEGMSFNAMSERTGEKVATLISRKRYAILALRARLAALVDSQGG